MISVRQGTCHENHYKDIPIHQSQHSGVHGATTAA